MVATEGSEVASADSKPVSLTLEQFKALTVRVDVLEAKFDHMEYLLQRIEDAFAVYRALNGKDAPRD